MAHLLFVDESGQDHRESPYEVLAGLAVEDRDLWNLISSLHDAEIRLFGRRYSAAERELKAKRLLKAKTFRLAGSMDALPIAERAGLAHRCLDNGAGAIPTELAALAQAKLDYVAEALQLCSRFRCKAFASIVDPTAIRADSSHLRKDYAYLFERFFYFLDDRNDESSGIIVFDELERSQSHVLVGQMERYFKHTVKGRQRAGRVIPEPFFVHSDLTTGIQLADLVAYIVAWGFRHNDMVKPARSELSDFAQQVGALRYRTVRELDGNPEFVVWSFTNVIRDLRRREER